ncbi:hypothetical protein H9L05_16140 [Hymenobacter qilianensis]|uniref:Uncharacterized protein n=1 Tax=Hymenobacter qilianensis TaxID=1385715 RepID=A0A7H0GTA4_9BACT|nr:hypothetical protein H9L05_16140 [Hymenobacter qilianensis]
MKRPPPVAQGTFGGGAPLAQRGAAADVVSFGRPLQTRPLGAVAELDIDVILYARCARVQNVIIVHVLAVLRLLLGTGGRRHQ